MTYGSARSLATLFSAIGAGMLIWAATRFDTASQGGYWSAVGLFVAAGMTVALSQMLVTNKTQIRSGFDLGAFLLAFLPVLVIAGWIILAATPSGSVAGHFQSWSGSLGIKGFVNDMGQYWGVLAFGLALMLDFSLRAASSYASETVAVAVAAPIAPLAAAQVVKSEAAVPVVEAAVATTEVAVAAVVKIPNEAPLVVPDADAFAPTHVEESVKEERVGQLQ